MNSLEKVSYTLFAVAVLWFAWEARGSSLGVVLSATAAIVLGMWAGFVIAALALEEKPHE